MDPFALVIAATVYPHACGEPEAMRILRAGSAVHSRACGGTTFITVMKVIPFGLSPRLRGNPSQGNTNYRPRR